MSDELELVTDRLHRLQRISGQLNRAVTVSEVVGAVMNVLDTTAEAATRGLWLHHPGSEELELVASAAFLPQSVERFARIAVDADLPASVAYRTQQTIVGQSRAHVDREFADLRGVERSSEAFVAVPLLLDDVCLGILSLGYDEPVGAGDVAFLEAVAGQVAQALARVRLTERDRRRREELEFLADLTDAALAAADAFELMENVTAAAVPKLGDLCSLYFLPEESTTPHIAVAHADPGKLAWIREVQARYPYDPERAGGVAAVIRTGETEVILDVSERAIEEAIERTGLDREELRPVVDTLALTSVITVPLLTKRRIVGALQFATAESGRHYDEADVALAEAVAGRLAEALDSAWLNDQHRQLAATLQRALLPPRLPAIPGVDLAARYWPAGGADVGGDFYDVFAVGADRWCVVIGDACGTGPNAAALTSIARHTVRAAARHQVAHREVVDWLNEAVLLSDRDLFCTACYTTLERTGDSSWLLRTAAAGHPLPVLARADGTTETIGRPGTLLGCFPSVTSVPVEAELHPGDLVVFYTDGVTDLPPPHGMTPDAMLELVDSLRDRRSAAAVADGIHESVLRRAPERSQRDDVALVVLRVTGT